MPLTSSTIKYEKRDRVAWVTISRPEVMNALDRETRTAIGEAFLEATEDDDVLVIIMIGEGGRAFSAGMDLKERAQQDSAGDNGAPPRGAPSLEQLFECPKPVVAAIDGYCLALGLEVALGCDIRIATEKSRFGLPEARRSILPGYGVHNIARMIPLGEAMWIILTGSHMTAQRAYDMGLIQEVVPDRDALIAEAERLAGEIKLGAPLAIQAIKRIVRVGGNMPVEYSRKFAEPILDFINKTEDRLEGPKAFSEKRDPVWKMR